MKLLCKNTVWDEYHEFTYFTEGNYYEVVDSVNEFNGEYLAYEVVDDTERCHVVTDEFNWLSEHFEIIN